MGREVIQELRDHADRLEFELEWVSHTPNDVGTGCIAYWVGLSTSEDGFLYNEMNGVSQEARIWLTRAVKGFTKSDIMFVRWNDYVCKSKDEAVMMVRRAVVFAEIYYDKIEDWQHNRPNMDVVAR